MAILSLAQIGTSFDDGRVHYQTVNKPTLASVVTAGKWLDLSVASGQPKYNAYAGAQQAATTLSGVGNDGIYSGVNYSGYQKYVARWNANVTAAVVPLSLMLCDYLMFYPLIDGDSLDQQDMDNTTTLTRYTSGDGVRAFLVAAAPMTANATCTMSYTNSDGVSGRTVTFSVVSTSQIGCLATSQGITSLGANTLTPFIPLASGDKGIRSVENITMLSTSGGFLNLVLCKPLHELQILEANVAAEIQPGFDLQRYPAIQSGAYLNILARVGAAAAWSLRSEIIFTSI